MNQNLDLDERRALMQSRIDSRPIPKEDADYAHLLVRTLFEGSHPAPDRFYVMQLQPLRLMFVWDVPWGRVYLNDLGRRVSVATQIGFGSNVVIHSNPDPDPGTGRGFRPLLDAAFSHPDLT